jgi:antitoxin ParD1/3/4
MDTMNFAVPEGLQDFVLERVAEGRYGSVTAYVGELIRADQIQKERARLEAEVIKGIDSPKAPMTDKDWADIRAEVHRRHEARVAQANKGTRE